MKVIDQCPGCPSTMDLSREAFEIIAKPVADSGEMIALNGRNLITRRSKLTMTLLG
ncbi:hypothetical protein Gohar_004400 [Gossypium harknessii]|uniref:Uncharacterized protein n=1 Tax=Gossypium harknessii TaxID=34285 RepID=A0A7J9H7C1_9ROSI|nr:hypothetical protein [Gossypium harknessii]